VTGFNLKNYVSNPNICWLMQWIKRKMQHKIQILYFICSSDNILLIINKRARTLHSFCQWIHLSQFSLLSPKEKKSLIILSSMMCHSEDMKIPHCLASTNGIFLSSIQFFVHNFMQEKQILTSGLSPEDGGSMFLQNGGTNLQVHTRIQPRRLTMTHTVQFELHNNMNQNQIYPTTCPPKFHQIPLCSFRDKSTNTIRPLCVHFMHFIYIHGS
jgi:hypothetical protein